MKPTTVFSGADILVPKFADNKDKMTKWAVIACDQFTSDRGYWETCVKIIDGEPSTYDYILPEAYLETSLEESRKSEIQNNMASFSADSMKNVSGYIYLERTLPNGTVRHGLIGKMDLEEYDYNVGSHSKIRATEATVVERIPSRCKVRESAKIELPHILVLIDDKVGLFAALNSMKTECATAYDFDLMQGGGHVTGYEITGKIAEILTEKIAEYEKSTGEIVYAMGDGNHSLAAAKAHWENLKKSGASMDHPARFALCEITALGDDSLVFEPIYRVVQNCDTEDFLGALNVVTEEVASDSAQVVQIIVGDDVKSVSFKQETHALTVGTLQNFIDGYIKTHANVTCDYIHGEDVVAELAKQRGNVGFTLDGMDKNDLFSYVEKNGTLPRKTFSMGEAESKRYYLESRLIVK